MASVRKRIWTHNGQAKEAWVVSYTDQGGKRRLKTFDRKKEAEAYRGSVEIEIEKGIHTPLNETVCFRQAAEDFLLNLDKRRQRGDVTRAFVRNCGYRLKRAIDHFGARRVSLLTSGEIQAFIDDLRLVLATRTVRGISEAVFMVIEHSVKRRWTRRNPLKDEALKLPKAEKRTAIPTLEDLAALLRSTEIVAKGENVRTNLNRRAFVCLGMFAGLRPGEICGLHWENVDFQNRVIRVRHSLSFMDGLKGPKTRAGIRDVPMVDQVFDALMALQRYRGLEAIANDDGWRAYRRQARSERLRAMVLGRPSKSHGEAVDATDGAIARNGGFVMTSKSGRPIDPWSHNALWRNMMQRADLIDASTGRVKFTAHALRHACVSLYLAAGLRPEHLKVMIGHENISTTIDTYGHLFAEDDSKAQAAHSVSARLLDATRTRQGLITA